MKRSSNGDLRVVVFADELVDRFVSSFELKRFGKAPLSLDEFERLAQFLYEPRPRLSAAAVADALRDAGAPEPWADATACVEVGTLAYDSEPQSLVRAQQALRELRLALTKLLEETSEQSLLEETGEESPETMEFLSGIESGLIASHEKSRRRIERFLAKLSTAPADLEQRRRSPPWQLNVLFLHIRYARIVGPCSVSANGPAVRFTKMMLDRLGIVSVSEAAVENVHRRGVKWPR